jgi:hypothetical protein
MHLVNAGSSGQYVLTPQLHADVDVSEADAEVEGEITSIDPDAKTFTVLTDDGDTFTVTVTDTTAIKSDDDSDDAGTDTGATVDLSFDALAVGQQVQVKGTFSPGNEVTSNEVDVDDASINTAV